MIKITLPWPPKSLSPNSRANWRDKAAAAQSTRRDAALMCMSQGLRCLPFEKVHVSFTFHPATNASFDIDNALARCKSMIDGIADAIGIDDGLWKISLDKGEKRKGGEIVVEIEGMDLK